VSRPPGSEPSPLAGKRVVVTRAPEQADGLCRVLEGVGAFPIRCPTIHLAPPDGWEEVDAALGRLGDYDWVVFTSANGVRFMLERVVELGAGSDGLRAARIATVGSRTAEALAERSLEAAFVGPSGGSIPLAEQLGSVTGARILLARSDRADPVAGDILRRRGAQSVDEVVAYRTLPSAPSGWALDELRRGVDALTFTSPSTVEGFIGVGPEWRALVAGVIVACLGPTTSAAAREAGLEVHVEPEEKSMNGLVRALAARFQAKESSP